MDAATPRADVAVVVPGLFPHVEVAAAPGTRLRVLTPRYSSTTSASAAPVLTASPALRAFPRCPSAGAPRGLGRRNAGVIPRGVSATRGRHAAAGAHRGASSQPVSVRSSVGSSASSVSVVKAGDMISTKPVQRPWKLALRMVTKSAKYDDSCSAGAKSRRPTSPAIANIALTVGLGERKHEGARVHGAERGLTIFSLPRSLPENTAELPLPRSPELLPRHARHQRRKPRRIGAFALHAQ